VDGLTWLPFLGQVGLPAGLVAITVWMVLTGKLVPRSTLDRERELRERERQLTGYWRDIALKGTDLQARRNEVDHWMIANVQWLVAVVGAAPWVNGPRAGSAGPSGGAANWPTNTQRSPESRTPRHARPEPPGTG
jgi:hypothetical protein